LIHITKSINENTKQLAHNIEYVTQFIIKLNIEQQIKVCLTVDNDNVYKGWKHVHGSKMQQPYGLLSLTFHARKI